jgi:6-phosphofructokinase 1
MISMQGGHFRADPFSELIDPTPDACACGSVDIHSTRYGIARRYMIRLRRDDFRRSARAREFAACAGLSLQEFRDEFEYLVESEPQRLIIDANTDTLVEAPASEEAVRRST